jgi:hypothetical protein
MLHTRPMQVATKVVGGRVHRMSTETAGRASRRAILTAAAGGAAALAVSRLAKPFPAEAAAGNMQTETDNATGAPTGVSNSAGTDALFGHATSVGTGTEGTSVTGIGVFGVSSDTSAPLTNERNTGVFGVAGNPADVDWNTSLAGVFGYAPASPDLSTFSTGVWGDSPDVGILGTAGGVGVRGDGGSFGVLGQVYSPGTIGVVARANDPGARALRVDGRAEFTRSGRTTISSGKSTKKVNLSGCTSNTLVLAVLGSNRSGRYVRAVVPASGSFTVYLNSTVSSTTNIVWIAFTNPANHGG